jgi:predicted N-acetyltransferase YhbS
MGAKPATRAMKSKISRILIITFHRGRTSPSDNMGDEIVAAEDPRHVIGEVLIYYNYNC